MLVRLIFSICAAAFISGAAQAAPKTGTITVWRNPQNSVHVRVQPCGASMCGTVIWANEKAKADSARGGTPNLIGIQLFRDFRESSPKVWTGKVFVPDLGRVFTGTATLTDDNKLVARGCLGKNLICKSQVWTAVPSAD